MARFLEDYKPKKKKKEETKQPKQQKVTKSPSVTKTNNVTKNSTFMGGGAAVKNTEQKKTSSTTPKRQTTTPKRTTMTNAQYQKTYGQPRRTETFRTSTEKRQQTTRTNSARLTEAQRQKMGYNSMATPEQSKAVNRAIKNTPGLVKKAVLDTVQGHGQTLADLTEMTASSKTGAKAKAMKMGIDPEKDKAQMAEVERERQRTAEAARLDREKWAAEQDKRQQEWDKKVNGAGGVEKAYYGAVESGTGMLTDLAIGLGTQGGSLAAMFSRTYGSTRGQAEKEGATENEDRAYSFLQAAKEVGTELIFPGVGLARGYAGKAGIPLAERVANNLTKNMSSRAAADITGAGVRLLGGTFEENAEEALGWGLDPLIKEFSYGRNARTRQAQNVLKAESDELRSNIQSEDDARRAAAYLSSSDFIEQNKQQYIDAGLSEKQAENVAELMRDYLTASLTGDTEAMEALEEDIASTVSGKGLSKKDWDKGELLDTFASTSLLTLTTGLPGSASTAMRGSVIRDNLGSDGIRALTETVMNSEDEEDAKRGEVARNRVEAGKELTSTQVYELSVAQAKQVAADQQRVTAKNAVTAETIRSEDLVAPIIMRDEKGEIHGDSVITSRYNENASEAEEVVKRISEDQKLSLSDSEVALASRAIAGFQTGAFTINDANALNYSNRTAREAFEEVTGIDLGQYVVKNRDGSVNYAQTNAATKDALFTMAAENYIETARAETENFKDLTKGITADEVSARVGSRGDAAISQALATVDPADADTYGLMSAAAQNVYEYGRYTEDSWNDVKDRLGEMYPSLSNEALRSVYESAKEDKAIAENPYYNARVRSGESTSKMDMSEAGFDSYGKFENLTGEDIGIKERDVLVSLAREFNINIRLMPSEYFEYTYIDRNGEEQTGYKNGWYDPKTGTMMLNGGNDAERNLVALALHETTHHIALYAPEEYLKLSSKVMETWYKGDANAFKSAIQRRQDSYKRQVKQDLSDEAALEEVIADAIGEMSADPDFISQICTEEPTLAQQIINAIKSVLRKIRAALASGDIAEEYRDAFFEQLDMWSEAQSLWLNAAKVAQQARAEQMIDDWDANARETASEETETNQSANADSNVSDNLDVVDSINEDKAEEISTDIGPDIKFSIPTFRDEKAKGKFIAALNGGKGGFAGLSEIASGKTILRRTMQRKGFSDKQTDAVVGFLEHMADYLEDENLQMKYHFIGWDDISNGEVTVRRDSDGNIVSVAVSAMVVNGEYPVNFDLTTICNKREGVMEVIQALTQKYDADTGKTILNSVKLTDEKMWSINKALKAEGIDTACLGCFVEARRYYTNRFIDKIDDVWNSAVREARRKLGLPEEEYFNFAKGRKIKGEDYNQISDLWTAYDESTESKRSPAQRIKILMDEIVKNKEVDSPYLKLISAEDILTPEGIRGFKELSTHNKDRDMVKMIKSIYGTSAPKEILAFTPYNSEIALLPDKIKGVETGEYLKSIGGTRVQSFSDFKMEHFFDHMQMVAEEAARGFVNHGYSKVIAYPRLFGLTGRKINMSVMFDVLPVAEWQKVLGCSPAAAVDVAQKYQGLRFVKEKPADNPDNRPYKEVTIEGVHGYLTYLVSDADYVNSVYDRLYQENIDAGMTPEEARRKANTDKPFEQSINYKDAVELENQEGYKENVGIIAVAFGDEHLRMLLDDPNVRYIIPYHRSGLPVFIAAKTALDIARNYTDFQNTNKAKRGLWINPEGQGERMKTKYAQFLKDNPKLDYPAITFFDKEINGKGYTVEFGKKNSKEKISLAGTGTFDVYENLDKVKDIREISNAYLEHCIENNQVPVFHEFAGHPNYYKMLFDFAVTDGTTDHIYPQRPVRNIYPGLNLEEIANAGKSIEDLTPEDFAEFYKEIERGLADQNAKTELRRNRLGKVMDEDILSQTGENSIIADSNIQHIVNGTPDYTSVRYANEDTVPEVTGADIRNSISEIYDDAYMEAVNSGNMEEAQRLVGEAANRAGYKIKVYHGTISEPFTKFMRPADNPYRNTTGSGFIYASSSEDYAENYAYRGEPFTEDYDEGYVLEGYLNIDNMLNVGGVDDYAFRPTDGSNDLFMNIDFNDEAKINDWATDDFFNVAKAVGMTPFELVQNLGETIFNESESTWEFVNRPEYAKIVSDLGHDGIKVIEDGSDAYGVLEPNQFKSADAVTYADDGSVIPLSQRFDPTNDDIRYSLPTQDSDGNILTDGQMEYFKNSQARDEQGRLVPVYHTTNKGGFTIFDPQKSDDQRSLFFTSNRRMSESYSKGDGKTTADIDPYNLYEPTKTITQVYDLPDFSDLNVDDIKNRISNIRITDSKSGKIIGEGDSFVKAAREMLPLLVERGYDDESVIEDIEKPLDSWPAIGAAWEVYNEAINFDVSYTMDLTDIVGTYTCYLNLENPLIVDAEGGVWDHIPLTIGPETGDLEFLTTREVAENAQFWGFDGVIIRNVIDYGDYNYGSEPGDVYIAFASNQVKDTRNTDPTENPDIRYSITDEEEAMSQIAYDDAMSDSYAVLQEYETSVVYGGESEFFKGKAYAANMDEEAISRFYDALRGEDAVPSDDPVFEEDRVRRAKSKEEFFNNVNAKWNDRWTSEGEVLDLASVKKDIKSLVMGVMANSDTDAKYRNEIVRQTLLDVRTAYQLMKQDRTDAASYLLYHSAQRMIDGVEFIKDDTAFKEYKAIRDFLRTYRINAPEEYWQNVEFNDFRKEYYGRLRIGKGNNNIESVYKDLEDRWPHLFNESEREKAGLGDAVEDLLQHIGVVVDSNVTPFMEAYSSEEAVALAYETADALYDIMAGGEAIESLADSYKNRFDAKTKAMKQRHAEAILRVRKSREEGIQKERQKFRAYKERQQENRLHSKHFEGIQKKYDELTKRLLTNTKDKHIPEQYKKELAGLLKAFDFQTVGSKKREARTGYKAKNTIKLEAMRTALEQIENNSQLFHINDSVTDIMKDLLGLNEASASSQSIEGKTLDELSASELRKIDKLLGALIHEFNNYEKVKVGTKKQQAADIGHAQNNESLKHAELFGPGKDFQNTPGWIDRIINLDEMTAAYLFKRIDPNKEGLGLMYGEIRKSFDKYVRNQAQLNDWMEEIVGKYHSKGILWNKYGSGELTNWRSERYAQTFNLENGTVKLTVAQMMSIACLANRKQAYDHMIGNGIVVAPVTFQAKLLTDLKKKVNKALPVRLTDADIKTIVTALTPEQRQVANKLQELMATKMADWGNEASMNVIGIRLFEDPDYFPIRSDRAGLTKDLDPNQFEQAIRNFGFTKAVQPGARNAIMVDDIFDVVTEHCNNMNLYNSYTEAMNDFMKVYNYRETREEGEYTVEQALKHAFSDKSATFILQFMRDLNGNVSRRASGIEDAYNSLLANSKKAAVFANLRVAAQQPTAITRAFAVIDPKYIKGIRIEKGAMKEMFEHCPIALWKSWGYYDINMGKSIEDIMMNNGKWLEDKATDLYGELDNVTWTAIWQMVKAEMKDTHPNVEIGSDEYWDLCNDRMSEIVDLTQVVDSPMHRSHAMRDKGFLKKTATAFMAEPTLTFNMLRDGYIRASEALRSGNKAEAGKIAARTVAVGLLQAATVGGMAAIVDALRKKKPDKDDDDDRFLHLWWVNALSNFTDELKVWNKIYFIKDIASFFEGWENSNLALQGIQKFALGYRQLTGDPYARSSASWYENMADGIGYMYGLPIKTMRTGLSNAMTDLGLESPFIEETKERLDSMPKDKKPDEETSGFIGGLLSDGENEGLFGKLLTTKAEAAAETDEEPEDSGNVPTRESLPDNLTDEQKDDIIKSAERRSEKATSAEEQEQLDYDDMLYKALKSASGLEGEEYNKKVYSSVANGLKGYIADGDYMSIGMMRTVIEEAGGDVEYFDKRVLEETKTAYKKSLSYDQTYEERWNQKAMYRYMMSHGMSQEELSSEILYKSDLAKDMKVAYRVGDNDMIYEAMLPLVDAGITQNDLDRLWENRNRMQISSYNGRYKDKLKSTGKFIWPTDGVITSHFGYRNAPTAGASSNHPAIDIGAPQGTAVVAADGGVVISAGANGGYGNSVGIKHDNGMVTWYNHLYAWNVKEGDTVAQGQQIAQVGSTGISTGPHLDFKILDINGNPVDPEKYLN